MTLYGYRLPMGFALILWFAIWEVFGQLGVSGAAAIPGRQASKCAGHRRAYAREWIADPVLYWEKSILPWGWEVREALFPSTNSSQMLDLGQPSGLIDQSLLR